MKRRDVLRSLPPLALPFLAGLPSLRAASAVKKPPQRLIFMFSPNGIVPPNFWPDQPGAGDAFQLKPILQPLAPFKERLLMLKGISNKIRGDGDSHQRGMSCLLTGIELYAGNIMGGGGQPAGWAKGPSIDQVIREKLQADPSTRTRFGSLEFGVNVPDRADPWTRWVYAAANKPMAPMTDPALVLARLYGQARGREHIRSILDDLSGELARVRSSLPPEERAMLEEHATLVRGMEKEMQEAAAARAFRHQPPVLEGSITLENDNMPRLSRMQTDLLVSALANDMARVATLQYTASVGGAKMRWLGIQEGHHDLSHDPDMKEDSQEKLTKINVWFAEQLAYLAQKLDSIPEPGHSGTMLDHTLIVWTNELGKGNSHTLDDIPFVCLGRAPGLKMNQMQDFNEQPHNRLHLTLAASMGVELKTHGNPDMCTAGPLALS
ncbi:MAG: DUF1552 domain-containing protein [Prosthecobacter sp.]|jgi:hypothetical protein|nr:DUF1552 domain-containing protein [Prosthecobacter sp.]